MLNSSLTFDWLGHVIVKNKRNIPGKEIKWRNLLWEILLALFYTHLVKKKIHKFDHQPCSQGSLRLTGIQIEFENEFKKIIFRPGANKNKKTKNQTVYHKTYLISIPRPATSVATRMSLAPALRLDKANSLKEDQQKESLWQVQN